MVGQHEAEAHGLFANSTYNVLKFCAQILIPALATLYLALAKIWDLPNAQEIALTAAAVDTFLGVILGLSSARYVDQVKQAKVRDAEEALPKLEKALVENADGDLKVFNSQEMPFLVELNGPLDVNKKVVTFVVKPQ